MHAGLSHGEEKRAVGAGWAPKGMRYGEVAVRFFFVIFAASQER